MQTRDPSELPECRDIDHQIEAHDYCEREPVLTHHGELECEQTRDSGNGCELVSDRIELGTKNGREMKGARN